MYHSLCMISKMSSCIDDKQVDEHKKIPTTERFSELFDKLGYCAEIELKDRIEELNEAMEEMNEEELKTVFTKEMFDKIFNMYVEMKLSMKNVLYLLKNIGYWKIMKYTWVDSFKKSSLSKVFKKVISDEVMIKRERNEKLWVDLCECHLFLNNGTFINFISICVPYLLKVALRKEKDKENQKEVEMAFMALRCFGYDKMEQELFLDEIKDIIQFHQKHRNLTHLAYQYAWEFLMNRFYTNGSLEIVIEDELHFAREASRELEELTRNVDWKRKEEKRGREVKEVLVIKGWLYSIDNYFFWFKLWNEEFSVLIGSIVKVFRASRDNHRRISDQCIETLRCTTTNKATEVDDLLKEGVVDLFSEEMKKSTPKDEMVRDFLYFFLNISDGFNGKNEGESVKAKTKATKMKMREKLEEEGFEDTIASFHETYDYINKEYDCELSLNISDYFVNV
eukprot:MONOS_10989.1-p1 / transcript=MONOS_10989.1 / gene=MONOS_10989 / organism=Monocercomonoides_exilis_PA203 / gene_product=unspecified product / transcript_product=unspecified product / location=Mono_scaffold00525:40999-42473(+) / protein_length=451 / sequence_SO=supercontig / SO=protein_coding / is_pseudo=false